MKKFSFLPDKTGFMDEDRYMTRLYIEVLKMIGLRGYNILPYQNILDDEKINDNLLKKGQLTDYKNDEYISQYVYSIYKNMLQIPNNASYPQLRTRFNSIFTKGEEKLLVFFDQTEESKSVSKENASKFVKSLENISSFFFKTSDYCNKNSCKIKAIFITKNNLTPGNQTWLSQISVIEHFLDVNLLCSISENILCSKRHILTESEKINFCQELDISLSKIPYISKEKDISYRFYSVEKNDVVKEERTSVFPESLTQKSITYRLCK
jgi:DNA-directed RNA polymerase subunit H (RpoH/RPB5)